MRPLRADPDAPPAHTRDRSHSALGFFATDVYLDQHLQLARTFLRRFIQLFSQPQRIDRINSREQGGSLRCFIALQMSDEVPLGAVQVADKI